MGSNRKISLNGAALKWIAIVTMTIDHIGYALFPYQIWMRYVGRIAFPIFCFLLVEGAVHTKNIRKYELRMLVFACIAEVPFDFGLYHQIYWSHQNVMFTMLLGLVLIDALRTIKHPVGIALSCVAGIAAATVCQVDYGGMGIVLILAFYWFRIMFWHKGLSLILIEMIEGMDWPVQRAGILALPFLYFYNGERGRQNRYFFYVYYPLHLLVIYVIWYLR